MWFSVRLDMGKICWLQVLNGRHNIVSMEGKVGGKKGSREGGREGGREEGRGINI